MILWTTGDMAREVGINPTSAAMWGRPGRRAIPEPYAVHGPQKVRLWTEEQARQIMADYREAARRRADRAADIARAEAALARLVTA
jgi:hypothetical protein